MWIKIKTFKHRPEHWNDDGEMDYLMGKTVRASVPDDSLWYYAIRRKNGNDFWYLYRKDVAKIIDKKHPKKKKKTCHTSPIRQDINLWESIYA